MNVLYSQLYPGAWDPAELASKANAEAEAKSLTWAGRTSHLGSGSTGRKYLKLADGMPKLHRLRGVLLATVGADLQIL